MPTPPTPNIPLAYAVKSGNTIHLYILIYSGSNRPNFPNEGTDGDATMFFNIVNPINTGIVKHFEHYSFNTTSSKGILITDIEISYNNHIRKIEVADLEIDPAWSQPGKQAFEVPYAYSQKVDANNFKVDMVIFSKTDKRFKFKEPEPPKGYDTDSVIEINGSATPTTELYEQHTFNVKDFMTTEGAHEVSYAGPPNRKTKTKNKNHSQTPFPRLIRTKKS